MRQQAKDYINAINASGATSIGDGMRGAVNQRNATPTSNPLCSFVLLSDGMENSDERWATVQADAVATHCPVTAIAFGSASDETLMQNIATATGGLYFYNDVFVSRQRSAQWPARTRRMPPGPRPIPCWISVMCMSTPRRGGGSPTHVGPKRACLRSCGQLEGGGIRHRMQTHSVRIGGPSVRSRIRPSMEGKSPRWNLKLGQPDGTIIRFRERPYTFVDYQNQHVGWRIANLNAGRVANYDNLAPFIPLQASGAADQPAAPSQKRRQLPSDR